MKQKTRIESIIDLLPPGNCLADIGTDHGYLAIEAIKAGKVQSVIASDISEKSLNKAKQNIKKEGYAESISTCVANGFQHKCFQQIDQAILAGMGGELISKICDQSPSVLNQINSLIIQPMTKITTVREWVISSPFSIVDEDLVWEKGKLYIILKAQRQVKKELLQQSVDEIGTILINKKHPLLYLYAEKKIIELETKRALLNQAKSDIDMKKKAEFLLKLVKMKELKSWSAAFKMSL
jgi:tRNA (adenine22-N1)-methyltransferase